MTRAHATRVVCLYRPVVRAIAVKLGCRIPCRGTRDLIDDLEQIGMLSVWNAAQRKVAHTNFDAYLRAAAQYGMLDHLRKWKPIKFKQFPLDWVLEQGDVVAGRDGPEVCWYDNPFLYRDWAYRE